MAFPIKIVYQLKLGQNFNLSLSDICLKRSTFYFPLKMLSTTEDNAFAFKFKLISLRFLNLNKLWCFGKFSGTVNFVELLIQHNTSPVGLGILWRPLAGLRHLGGLGQVRLG